MLLCDWLVGWHGGDDRGQYLGTQLIRRNDELALLYEKIRIQQSTLNKGEVQYRQRLEEIKGLK